jgi:hypothetical protein
LDFESETFVASGRGYWNEANGSQPIGTQARAIYESTVVTVGTLSCNTGPNGHDAGNFQSNQGVDSGYVIPIAIQERAICENPAGGQPQAVAFNLRGREGGSQPEPCDQASLRSASEGSSRSYVAVGLDSQLNGEIEGIDPLNIGSSSGGGQPARVAQESSVIGGKGSAMQVRRLTPL